MNRPGTKLRTFLALTAVMMICGANEGSTAAFQFDGGDVGALQQPRSSKAWKLPHFGVLTDQHSESEISDPDNQFVRLRPNTRDIVGGSRSIDMKIFVATPDGRPISDTYDLASLDPDSFAAIKPIKPKKLPVEKPNTPKMDSTIPPNETLDLGVKTLNYIVLTTKLFLEHLSRSIYNSP